MTQIFRKPIRVIRVICGFFPTFFTVSKIVLFSIALLATVALVSPSAIAAGAAVSTERSRIVTPFDADWLFLKADAAKAEDPAFKDAGWRALSVPHDWSIEGPFDQNNPTRGAGAFLPAGTGWYRKHFALPQEDSRLRVFIEFDGVMANSDVWINGFHLGKRPYGYVSFRYELTGHLNFGKVENVIAVRADNSAQPASRWYAGAGIYRHVRLVALNPVHLGWDAFVSTPRITDDVATIHVQSSVLNQAGAARKVTVQTTILAPDGQAMQTVETTQNIFAGQPMNFQQDIAVKNPQLWDLDHPNLYRARIKVLSANIVLDDDIVPFGIREFHFDAAIGFSLNGKNFKVKGVCLHSDAGAFGTAVPLRAWERRLEQLKQLGVNAIRTAHNPPAPEFLDLCDRMGLLVMDEMFDCWTVGKNSGDYHLFFNDWSKTDTRDTVLRDRNHPSIILYSAGNEIHDTPNENLAKGILKGLIEVFHANDPTRPVTQALFRPNRSHDYTNGLADMLDVVGQNYREKEILAAHQAKPSRKIIGTENGHDRTMWVAMRDNPQYAGQFLWSGVDYLGEARNWPGISRPTGLLDRTDTPRPMGFERQSWWSDKPMVSIARRTAPAYEAVIDPGYDEPVVLHGEKNKQVTFPDWSPANREKHDEQVEVYSNCDEVELFLNDKSLGAQPRPADASARKWTVPFEPGTLKAIAKNKGAVVATHELRTAGKPAKILLAADREKLRADWDDVSYVSATIVDENGVPVPDANDLVTFKLSGPGVIAAVDNADNNSHEPFQASERHAYQGQCFAIVRATGTSGPITLTASAPDRTAASISIATQAPQKAASN